MTQRPASTEPQNNAPPPIGSGTRNEPVEGRRRGVVRTAWAMAGLAFAIYVLFILSGVLAQ